MSASLFLFRDPFVVIDNERNRNQYKLDYLNDHDRQDEERLRSYIFKFTVDEGLVVEVGNNRIQPALSTNTGSWIWFLIHMNFRSLVDMNQYGALMTSLQSNNSHSLNQIIDLHSRLGAFFDERVLNTIVHRTLSSIGIIPYDVSVKSETTTWERIHIETPFVWLVIFIQMVIRTTAIPLGTENE